MLRLTTLENRTLPAWIIATASGDAPGAEPLGFGYYRTDTPALYEVTHLETDAVISAEQIPNDPQFGSQYALQQIQAPAAWDVTTGTGTTVVAVIDSGVDTTHPDLIQNLWTNPGELPGNGRDDDNNGYIDDIHGYDFIDHDGMPNDPYGHGTHVAGIIGATANNAAGVAGVAWQTRIMPLRFLDAYGRGSTSDAIRALDYAIRNGAKISNHSWGGAIRSDALTDAITRARTAGHIVVAAAGNSGRDTDLSGNFPASFASSFDNVVSVAATNWQDQLAGFSNYGATTVTLAAPGDSILSTLPNNRYGPKTGTSMATPFVSAALALAWDQHPDWSYSQIITQLKESVDPLPSLTATQTGGRMNLARMLGGVVTVPPTVPPPTLPPPGSPPVSPPPPPIGFVPTPVSPLPVAKRETIIASAPQAGVRLLNVDGTTRTELLLTDAALDGARVAGGDLNGDGTPEIVLATGPGFTGRVVILDGESRETLREFVPFGDSFRGGVFAALGDLTGDGVPDLAVSPDHGGGARVRLFDGRSGQQINDFFAIDDPRFRGGARAAIGDLNGDGFGDLAVGAGTGGGPRIALFDGATLTATPARLTGDFFAFEPKLRNGTYLALGDLDGDGFSDLIAGAGPGGGPRVTAFSGAKLLENQRVKLADFFSGDVSSREGVRVGVKDLDGDGRADLVTGGRGRVAAYPALTLTAVTSPSTAFGFDIAFGGLLGVYVG